MVQLHCELLLHYSPIITTDQFSRRVLQSHISYIKVHVHNYVCVQFLSLKTKWISPYIKTILTFSHHTFQLSRQGIMRYIYWQAERALVGSMVSIIIV